MIYIYVIVQINNLGIKIEILGKVNKAGGPGK